MGTKYDRLLLNKGSTDQRAEQDQNLEPEPKPGTEPDLQNFENLGPIRTGRS